MFVNTVSGSVERMYRQSDCPDVSYLGVLNDT